MKNKTTIETRYTVRAHYDGQVKVIPIEVKFTEKVATVTSGSETGWRTLYSHEEARRRFSETPQGAAAFYLNNLCGNVAALESKLTRAKELLADHTQKLAEYL